MNELLIHNARIRTLELGQPTAEAILLRDGRIAAIGSNADLISMANSAQKLDAAGRAVLPGFIDSHVHFWMSGLVEQAVDLRQCRSIPEVLAAIRHRAAEQPTGTLLMARGFQDTAMAENRFPLRSEMDAAAPEHLVWIRHNNGHGCAVNSKTLEYLRIPTGTPGVEVDGRTGEPTGVLREKIRMESEQKLYHLVDPAVFARCLDIASEMALRAGVCTVHCLEGGRIDGDPDVVDLLARKDTLPVNSVLYYQITDVDRILELGLPRIGGCILIDGSPAVHTAALAEPYSDRPDTIGPTYWQQDELDDFVWRAHSSGLQIAVHATSERAINQILTAYERAISRLPRPDHRHRIEHFYFPLDQDIERAARLGVCSGVQPIFEQAFRQMYRRRLGPERAGRVHRYRRYLDAGMVLGGGSDCFVTPIDPISGISAAVNHSVPEHRIKPEEAVRMFTVNNAFLAFEEHETGSLRVGKRGDLVLLSDDPLSIDPEAIGEITVEATVVRGNIAYQR